MDEFKKEGAVYRIEGSSIGEVARGHCSQELEDAQRSKRASGSRAG
ncbi:hypothetical protein P4S68_11415 [Pseudoalteromonas sp. Hal099]